MYYLIVPIRDDLNNDDTIQSLYFEVTSEHKFFSHEELVQYRIKIYLYNIRIATPLTVAAYDNLKELISIREKMLLDHLPNEK